MLFDKGKALLHALSVGDDSTSIRKIKSGTITVDPADAATGHEKVSTNATITGVAVGDIVILEPPSALEDDLIPAGAVVTAADTVAVKMYAGAAVNGASRVWRYLWIDLT
jgi:hypothetical protein